MRVDQAGHECRTHTVDHGAAVRPGRGRKPRRSARNLFDAIALNDDFAGVRIFAGGIKNSHIGELYRPGVAAVRAVCFIGHDASSFAAGRYRSIVQIAIPRTNSGRSLLHSFDFSIGVQWPQRLRITALAPPILSASSCAMLGVPTVSSSPACPRYPRSPVPGQSGRTTRKPASAGTIRSAKRRRRGRKTAYKPAGSVAPRSIGDDEEVSETQTGCLCRSTGSRAAKFGYGYAAADSLWQQGGRSEAWRPLSLGWMVCPTRS